MTKFTKITLSLSFLLLLLGCSADQAPNESHELAANKTQVVTQETSKEEPSIEQISKDPEKKHSLWRVAGRNGNTMYIVGSVHLMKPDVYPLDPVFEEAYQDAEKLVFEIDQEILDPVAAQAAVQKYAGIEGATSLREKISDDDYAEIRQLANEQKVPMMLINTFDPWFSSTQLAVMQYLNAGYSPEHGIDLYFMNKAIENNKPISGLETLDLQFSIFDSMSYNSQVEMLRQTLTEAEDIGEMVNQLDENWRDGDMDELEDLLFEEFEDAPEFYNKLLKTRNENWIPQLLPMLSDENDDYLVVVGAAHMLGKDGLIKLLSDEGFVVEQL